MKDRLKVVPALIEALVGRKEFEQAQRVIEDVDADDIRLSAFLVESLISAGEFERAVKTAEKWKRNRRSAVVLTPLVCGLANAGQLERAVSIADEISDPIYQALLLTELARIDSSSEGRRLAEKAEELASSGTDPYYRAESQLVMVEALAAIGGFSEAEQIAVRITQSQYRIQALNKLIHALVEAGNVAVAEALVASTRDDHDRGDLGRFLASALIRAGAFERAENLVTTELIEAEDSILALSELAQAMGDAGDRAAAKRLAARAQALATARVSDEAEWEAVAEAQVAANEYDQALSIALTHTDGVARARTLAALVPKLVDSGELAAAQRMAARVEEVARHDIQDHEGQVHGDALAVRAWGDAQDLERAERVARESSSHHAAGMGAFVEVLTEVGQFERATEIVHWFHDEFEYVVALVHLARSLATAGDRPGALRFAGQAEEAIVVFEYSTAGAVMTELALMLVEAVQVQWAKRIALSITGSGLHNRPRALTAVAGSLIHERDREETRRNLILAMGEVSWHESLPVVAKLDPAVIRALASDVLAKQIL